MAARRDIEDNIRKHSPTHLKFLRLKLHIEPSGELSPSDVHDYLVDLKKLDGAHLKNVHGGNVLVNEHIQPFFQAFEKLGAAAADFYFHEHCTAIYKVRALLYCSLLWIQISFSGCHVEPGWEL